jgi:hypothetical protein
MKIRLFILITLINLYSFSLYGQDFEGYYTGKLLTENNLLIVDKDKKGNHLVELHSSEKSSFKLDATISDTKLIFLLPTLDGSDLEISVMKIKEELQLSLNVSGEKYTTLFKKIELPRRNAVNAYFEVVAVDREVNLDPNLIGEWRLIGSFDIEENPIKDEFFNKNYIETFLKDGTCHLDPRYFFDLDKKNGRPDLFRPGDIPLGTWSTSDNQTLKRLMGAYSIEHIYKISNDTLRVFSPNGIKLIYIKRK